jgi:hypothetical protein
VWAWSHSLVQWTWSRLRSAYIYMQEQYFICAYTGSHDRAYVWYEYMRKSNSAYVCIDLQKWPLLCVHKHARSIALLPAYKCIHNQAYVCIYVRASLHLSVHIHAGMVAPMCTYMRRLNSIHECYTCSNNSAHVRIYAWVIAHMCAYTCRHGCTYACIYLQAR